MNTVTTVESVEKKGDAFVATLLGGKKAGTTDELLGNKLLEIYASDPENCLVEVKLEQRGERYWLLEVDYIEPPGPDQSAAAIEPSSYPEPLVAIRTELTAARVALGNAMTLIEAQL